jgi:hypothetical protein
MFTRRRAPRVGVARSTAARADQLQQLLADAQSFGGVAAVDVPDMRLRTTADERVFLCIHGASLIEPSEDPDPIDRGEFVVTTVRAVFTGTKQVRQWAWSALDAVEHSEHDPSTTITVSNRRRTFGVLYDDEHRAEIRFSIDLGVAAAKGTRDELVGRISGELTELQSELSVS